MGAAREARTNRRRVSWALLAGALGCALGCAAQPYRARVRQEAAYRLRTCFEHASRPYRGEAARRACFGEVAEFCRAQGLEAACALGDAWTNR